MSRPSSHKRKPWLAVLLSLPSPLFGMLYVGRARRALAYLGASLLGPYVAYELARRGFWPAGLSWLAVPLAIGLAGCVDAYRIAKRHARRFSGGWFTSWRGLSGVWVATMLVTLAIHTWLFEPFLIPSESMLPTLVERDQIFVSRLAYRSLSIPFTSIELRGGARPRRGDLVVFRPAADPAVAHVKRIIGLPGDVVAYDPGTKRLRINGGLVVAEHLGYYEGDAERQLVREVLDTGEHRIVLMRDFDSIGGLYIVPAEHYFMLGDNRDNSLDSRFAGVEYVPAENIDGRVSLVWWNTRLPGRAGTKPR